MKQKIGEIVLSSIYVSNVMHQIHIMLQQSRLSVMRLKCLFLPFIGKYAFKLLNANGNSSCCGVRLIKSNLHFRRFGSFCHRLSYIMTDPALLERNNCFVVMIPAIQYISDGIVCAELPGPSMYIIQYQLWQDGRKSQLLLHQPRFFSTELKSQH